jgi:hypothetical protein
MAAPLPGRPQLQPLGVLVPGTTAALFFRRDGRALWRYQGRATQALVGWTDAGLPPTVVYEALASLTHLLHLIERQEQQIAELEQANVALQARLNDGT